MGVKISLVILQVSAKTDPTTVIWFYSNFWVSDSHPRLNLKQDKASWVKIKSS